MMKMVNNFLVFEDLSEEEQYAVNQLKSRMVGSMSDDMYEDLCMFVRFLRARDLNLDATEKMMRNMLEWRKTNQVDTIITDYTPKEVCLKHLPFDGIGIDKEGYPIIYIHLGPFDARGIEKSCRKNDVILCFVHKAEKQIRLLKEQSHKLGRHIDKFTAILDFDGLTFAVATHKLVLELVGNLLSIYEANYPERLNAAYLINASIYFTMGFAVVKHFLSEKTLKKLRVFGRDGWKEELQKVIDNDVLPSFLGGSRTDPDGNPLCENSIVRCKPIPESYYRYKLDNTLAGKPGVKKITITRRSRATLPVDVDDCDSHIEWEFETKSRDIGFALYYKKNWRAKKVMELIPNQRINTTMFSESGMYKCEKPGIYIVLFDNSYSWVYQKEIFYRIKVVKN